MQVPAQARMEDIEQATTDRRLSRRVCGTWVVRARCLFLFVMIGMASRIMATLILMLGILDGSALIIVRNNFGVWTGGHPK